MRVLHFIYRYWPGLGGAENYLREISERLVGEGHQVTIATSDADETELFWNPAKRRLSQPVASHNGVQIVRFPLRHWPLAPLSYSIWRYLVFGLLMAHSGLPIAWLTWLARFTPWTPDLWQWIETTPPQFDIVGAMGVLYESFVTAACRAATRWQTPWVFYPLTHLGAGARPGHDSVSRYYTMPHQIALVRAADKVILTTPTEAQFYASHGVAADRMQIGGAGVNPAQVVGGNADRFWARHQVAGPIVTFLSAMTYDKGAITLVEALRRLWHQGEKIELVMAGTVLDPFRRYLLRLPRTERERVRVLGSITEEEKRDLLAASDVVVMPSRTDSFGIIYLEAWLYQKPVIGARAWGMADVIEHGRDGWLVPFGDEEALAQALHELLANPALRLALGRRGESKTLTTYTWDAVYARVRGAYLARDPRVN